MAKKETEETKGPARGPDGRFIKKTLKEETSSVVSSTPVKEEDKTESKNDLLSYLQENFPLIINLIKSFSKKSEDSNKENLDKLSSLEKIQQKNKEQTSVIQGKIENSRKLLTAIDEKLGEANKQRQEAADIEIGRAHV